MCTYRGITDCSVFTKAVAMVLPQRIALWVEDNATSHRVKEQLLRDVMSSVATPSENDLNLEAEVKRC